MNSNDRQTRDGAPSPASQPDPNRDRTVPPASPYVGGWQQPVPTGGRAGEAGAYPQPGGYPPEHAPYARPPGGQQGQPPYGAPGQQGWGDAYPPNQAQGGYPPAQGHGGPQPYHPGWQQGNQPSYPPSQQRAGEPRMAPGQAYQAPGPDGRPLAGSPPPGFSVGRPVPPTVRKRRGSILPAIFFGLLAVILGAAAVYLYLDQRDNGGPIAPTALPAQNTYIQVENAIDDADSEAVTERENQAGSYSLFPVRTPGQAILIDGHMAWIYLFNSVEDQEAATAAWTAAGDDVPPIQTASGRELTTATPILFSGSNVVIMLSTDESPSEETRAHIQEAVSNLP